MTVAWSKVGKDYYVEEYWTSGSISGYRNYTRGWPIHRAIAKLLYHVLEPMMPGMTVLDVGGAFGYHLAILKESVKIRGFTVDASEYAIKNQAPEIEAAFWLDVGEDRLPFEDGSMDRVVSIEAMEHIFEPEVDFALGEMFRVLKPGGLGYSSIACGPEPDPNFIDKTHQTMHPLEWWIERFKDAGFTIRPDIVEKARNYEVPTSRDGGLLVRRMRWNLLCFSKDENKEADECRA